MIPILSGLVLNHLNILCFKILYYQILYCSIYKNRNYQDIMNKSCVYLEGKNYIEKKDEQHVWKQVHLRLGFGLWFVDLVVTIMTYA